MGDFSPACSTGCTGIVVSSFTPAFADGPITISSDTSVAYDGDPRFICITSVQAIINIVPHMDIYKSDDYTVNFTVEGGGVPTFTEPVKESLTFDDVNSAEYQIEIDQADICTVTCTATIP